jgi:hypothetical protein
MLVHHILVPRLVVHSRSKLANESLDLVWPIGALHAFWSCKACLYLSNSIHSCFLSIELQSKA